MYTFSQKLINTNCDIGRAILLDVYMQVSLIQYFNININTFVLNKVYKCLQRLVLSRISLDNLRKLL